MNSQDIQDHLYNWITNQNFDAPYGILTSQHVNSKGNRYFSITFGRARTLDATVDIYNHRFIILKTSRFGTEIFTKLSDLLTRLASL